MSNFCDIIKRLREEKGYSQEVLAEELGVSKSTIAMWETNKRFPGKELYEQIADLFNVDIDFLYGRTEIRKKHHFDHHGNEYINVDSNMTSKLKLLNEYDKNTKLLTKQQKLLLSYFNKLDATGKKKVLDNAEDLTKIYNTSNTLKAAHNDNVIDLDEIGKMNQDLDDLKD